MSKREMAKGKNIEKEKISRIKTWNAVGVSVGARAAVTRIYFSVIYWDFLINRHTS